MSKTDIKGHNYSDIEIASKATLEPITDVAERLDIPADGIRQYGPHIGKLDDTYTKSLSDKKDGKLVLVTAITPTPAGEGKTTTTIGLGDGLRRLGKKTAICLREPSLGPCFGMKGGAAGGGYAQVVPMEEINLHFTGDFHAITSAHNLLSALIDNHIHWSNDLDFDVRRMAWKRVMDMNDRALRSIVASLGGTANGIPRQGGFDITVASEVMAIFCLARNLEDLKERLGRILVGYTRKKKPIFARDLNAQGAMAALLRDAMMPNIVQTLEGTPAFIHGGPFANIAHGCNSVIATTTALRLADYTITEAGFGADLGAEKFFDIKCRQAGLKPDAAVVVATIRALKSHGGVEHKNLSKPDVAAVKKGLVNLGRHLRNVKKFGVPAVVAINHFSADTDEEIKVVEDFCKEHGVEAYVSSHWAEGGAGAEALAQAVVDLAESDTSQFCPLYDDEMPLLQKVRHVARELYDAEDVVASTGIRKQLAKLEERGYGHLPVCIAKTQYSFSTDPKLRGAPSNHHIPIREIYVSAGAGFIVVVCGDIMRMPGLPRVPAANKIDVDKDGKIQGLF